jgi:uncharacterized membrane protein YedE/YeeE
MFETYALALLGGGLIGGAAALLWLTHGRIAGISGIVGSAVVARGEARGWRLAFLGGLGLVGLVARWIAPAAIGTPARSLAVVAVAGVLVGYGTRLGSGCTSGHGVCGLSRGSTRSLVAVVTFMATGALTAWIAGAL